MHSKTPSLYIHGQEKVWPSADSYHLHYTITDWLRRSIWLEIVLVKQTAVHVGRRELDALAPRISVTVRTALTRRTHKSVSAEGPLQIVYARGRDKYVIVSEVGKAMLHC